MHNSVSHGSCVPKVTQLNKHIARVESEALITVTVGLLSGEECVVEVPQSASVDDLKRAVAKGANVSGKA